MKSVIVGKEFKTGVTDITALTRGQIALIDQNGVEATYASKMVQFVVGLGDKQVKRGVWINPKQLTYVAENYQAENLKSKIVFTGVTVNANAGYHGTDAEVVIQVKPLNSFGGYPLETFLASATMNDAAEDSEAIITRLNAELAKVYTKIKNRFGVTLSGTISNGTLTITCDSTSFEWYANLDGMLKCTAKTETVGSLGVGTYKQVSKLEKECDVANAGYNPAYNEYEKMYGDIFLAEKDKTYGIVTIVSQAPHTHPFHMHTEGLDVTQFVALEGGNPTAIAEVLSNLNIPKTSEQTASEE